MRKNKEQLIKSAKAFEFYVSKVWPLHRMLVRSKLAKRCTRCAASERMISLNTDGICETCLTEVPIQTNSGIDTNKDLVEFNEILQKAQGSGLERYDALTLFSGGKDSAYLISRIKDEYPDLRLLAITVDNGFMSPVAKENIDELLPKLNVDHLFVRPSKDFYNKLFRYGITHLNEDGGSGTVDFSDGEFILDVSRNIAAEKNIPLILCGYSKYQIINGLKFNSYEYPSEHEAIDRTHVANLPLADFHNEDELKQWWRGSEYTKAERPRLLFPLYCWDLEEEEILNAVKEKKLVSKTISPIVTNHLFIPVLGVVDVHRYGYSSYEKEFCRMIRDGKADLIHWRNTFELLEYSSKTGVFLKDVCVEMLDEIGLSLEDVGIEFS